MTLDLDFAFTAKDSPALRARIRRDLDRVWRKLSEADPALRALVLTGGFSRGEGSAVGARPLNDYDFVAVRDLPWPPASRMYPEVRERLERDLALHVDLLPVWRGRLRTVARKAFWFDLKHGGRVIAGDPRVLDAVPVNDAARLSKGEGPRLLANRSVGLLEALPGPEREADPLRVRLQSAKGVLAVVECALVLHGQYAPSLRERLARFRSIGKTLPGAHDWVDAAEWATAFKLDPEGPAATLPPEDAWERARRLVLACAQWALPHAGWGRFEAYPRGAPFEPVEWAYATVRQGEPAPPKASHAVRAEGFRLLERVQWPGVLPKGHAAWPAPLDALQIARERTLH